MKPNFLRSLAACGLALFAAPIVYTQVTEVTPTPDPVRLVTFGADYSTGKYGLEEETEVFSIPVGLTYRDERWLYRVTIPYIFIKGPSTVVGEGGALGGAPLRRTDEAESGVGDLFASATRMFGPVLAADVQLDLTGRVKLPTGMESKGLSTGQMDFYVQADVYRAIGDFMPFAALGYRILGNTPRYQLENGFYFSHGTTYRLSAATVVGASLDWRQALVEDGDAGTELTVFISHEFNETWSGQAYVLKGFTDASPEFGFGGSLNLKF